jgi:hypothetical protein
MIVGKKLEFAQFLIALNAIESGYHTGQFNGRRYGVTIERRVGARVTKLFAEELGGSDFVSFNLFKVGEDQEILKPCEMAAEKVIEFVLKFKPECTNTASMTNDVVVTK